MDSKLNYEAFVDELRNLVRRPLTDAEIEAAWNDYCSGKTLEDIVRGIEPPYTTPPRSM